MNAASSLAFPSIRLSRLALREGNAKKPVYTMHKWWARRLGVIFRMLLIKHAAGANAKESDLWEQFYSGHILPPDFRVLDPFLGAGTTLIEAAKQGASCIGVDIDPVACFITELELRPPDSTAIQQRFDEIDADISTDLRRFYKARVYGAPVDVIYYFWVDRVTCVDCGSESDAHPTYQLAYDAGRNTQVVLCPHCGELTHLSLDFKSFTCWNCREKTTLADVPVVYGRHECRDCGARRPLHELCKSGWVRPHLFAHEFLDEHGGRGFAAASPHDRALYTSASRTLQQHSGSSLIPNDQIPSEGRSDQRPLLYGYRRYREMFNDRQLLCLGRIAESIRATRDKQVRRALALAFSHSLATNNMFCSYAFGYRRLCPIFSVHAFRKVPRPVEGNVWGISAGRGSFKNAVRAVISGSNYMRNPFEYRYTSARQPERVSVSLRPGNDSRREPSVAIHNQSSEKLSCIPSRSVDLVLTDPPYYDNLSYSELSDFYHVWIRKLLRSNYIGAAQKHTPMAQSIYGGKRRGAQSEIDQYAVRLTAVLSECRRVVKDSGALIFTFHHRSPMAWDGLGRAVLAGGFKIVDVCPVRSEGRSGLHTYEGTIKWDAIFVCAKGPRTSLRVVPDSRDLRNAIQRAKRVAQTWTTHIRRSRLAFGDADRESFAMALLLKNFSTRNLDTRLLKAALDKLAESGTRHKVRANGHERSDAD